MTIFKQLSSQMGDRTEAANRNVVAQCLAQPTLLIEIADGLSSKDVGLLGDCAEVLTQVAEQHPDWVAPHAQELASLLRHRTTRVRWEAMHALALITASAPKAIASLLPQLNELIHQDNSTIVRDYAVDALANYASTDKLAGEAVYPSLVAALTVWGGKHAGRALKGLIHVAVHIPTLRSEIQALGLPYLNHEKGVIRKAAAALLKAAESKK